MTTDVPRTAASDGDASTAQLVSRATEQISTLVRDELALARTEMVAKGKRAGMGGGLLGGAGLFALYGLGLLFALCVIALDIVWPAWLAALVVTAGVFAIAGLLALVGRAQLKKASPPVPHEAIDGVSADVETLKRALQEGRRS